MSGFVGGENNPLPLTHDPGRFADQTNPALNTPIPGVDIPPRAYEPVPLCTLESPRGSTNPCGYTDPLWVHGSPLGNPRPPRWEPTTPPQWEPTTPQWEPTNFPIGNLRITPLGTYESPHGNPRIPPTGRGTLRRARFGNWSRNEQEVSIRRCHDNKTGRNTNDECERDWRRCAGRGPGHDEACPSNGENFWIRGAW